MQDCVDLPKLTFVYVYIMCSFKDFLSSLIKWQISTNLIQNSVVFMLKTNNGAAGLNWLLLKNIENKQHWSPCDDSTWIKYSRLDVKQQKEHAQNEPVSTVSERGLNNRMNKEDKSKLLESFFLDKNLNLNSIVC